MNNLIDHFQANPEKEFIDLSDYSLMFGMETMNGMEEEEFKAVLFELNDAFDASYRNQNLYEFLIAAAEYKHIDLEELAMQLLLHTGREVVENRIQNHIWPHYPRIGNDILAEVSDIRDDEVEERRDAIKQVRFMDRTVHQTFNFMEDFTTDLVNQGAE